MSLERWEIVENIAKALEAVRADDRTVDIVQKASLQSDIDPKVWREVDVLARVRVQGRTISIGVDVKDKGRPVDLEMMQGLIGKWESIHGSLDRYCVVSTSGFTETAVAEAKRKGVQLSSWRRDDQAVFRLDTFSWRRRLVGVEIGFDRATRDAIVASGGIGDLETVYIIDDRGVRRSAGVFGKYILDSIPGPSPEEVTGLAEPLSIRTEDVAGFRVLCVVGEVAPIHWIRVDWTVDRTISSGKPTLRYKIELGDPDVEAVEAMLWEDPETKEITQHTAIIRKRAFHTTDSGFSTVLEADLHAASATPAKRRVGKSEK